MRTLPAISRRCAVAVSAWTLAAVTTQVNRPALALVDGIPLYAPGEKIALPERGFEYWLPRMEQIQSVALPAVRSTVSNGDWASLSPFFGTVPAQLSVFGNLASIMGDEAYTIITIKARYSKAASKLLAITSSPNPSQQEALLRVQELEQCTAEALGLVPQKVVEQVRARERALQAEMSATRPSSPP